MMSNQMPWDELKTPQSELTVRRIKGPRHLTLYWAKDVNSHCMMVLELEGNHVDIYRKNIVSVHGIKTDLREIDASGRQGLVIILEKHIDQDLFLSLCNTLISALTDIADPAIGLSVALAQIKRWKTFLAGRKAKLLTSEEVRGLFSELTFLQSMLQKGYSCKDALEAWQGPEASHQDFIYSNTAVEVKSLSGKEKNTVSISSENQLEGVNDNLYLLIYRLIEMSESNKSHSLNQMVKVLESLLIDSESLECFSEKLAKAGYVELHDYDSPRFVVAEIYAYQVSNDFPRLTRSSIPDGVVNISYEIKLEKISKLKCDLNRVWC